MGVGQTRSVDPENPKDVFDTRTPAQSPIEFNATKLNMVNKMRKQPAFSIPSSLIFSFLRVSHHHGWVILFITILVLMISGRAGAQAEKKKVKNSCVECHKQSTGNPEVDRHYFQWEDSWHAAKHVTCDKCHGGKPDETLPAVAHADILESEGKKTASYYLKMDTKCGQCHSEEYVDFSMSSHYRFLEEGEGPSCITCHNPKTGHTLSVQEIVASCVNCHNEKLKGYEHIPRVARLLLDTLSYADFFVQWAQEFIFLKGKATKEKAWARSKLVDAEIELFKSKKQWHLFNLNDTEAHIKKAIEFALEAKKLVD